MHQESRMVSPAGATLQQCEITLRPLSSLRDALVGFPLFPPLAFAEIPVRVPLYFCPSRKSRRSLSN